MEVVGRFGRPAMIPTPTLCARIVRYLSQRDLGRVSEWTSTSEIAHGTFGGDDLVFNDAIDLAKCRGWIVVAGISPARRARLTKAGLRLLGTDRRLHWEGDPLSSNVRSGVGRRAVCGVRPVLSLSSKS